MSEYNIQMNKYNALNAEYDQLYPKPMKHANTHAEDGNDPITPSMIGTYNKTEIDTALQKKAEVSHTHTPASIGAADASILGQTIKASGEVGIDGYTVVYASLCLKKLTGTKCDFYISYKINSNTKNDNYFHFMSYSKICSLLGIKSLSCTDARNSQVIIEESISLSGSDLTIISPILGGSSGYTGIHAFLSVNGDLQLGRLYDSNYNFGTWPLNKAIFTPGICGKINFYGADYSI